MTHTRPAWLTVLAALLVAGCAHAPAPHTARPPIIEAEWNATLEQAIRETQAARFTAAERVLAEFARRYPDTGEGGETLYWRALFKLDPTNAAGSTREAAALLDSYLAMSPAAAHRAEAATLRRLAAAVEARVTAVATPPVQPVHVDQRAHEEEIVRLRDELARANAELDRIKRRLSRP